MQFNFAAILQQLNANLPASDNFAFRIARALVIPVEYVFNQILPQENRMDYHVDGGTLTITPTMLGQVPMDSPYPPFGAVSTSTFFENTTKLGGQMFLPEKQQRELQQWERSFIATGVQDGQSIGQIFGDLSVDSAGRPNSSTVNGRRLDAVLGMATMIVKSHWDTYEWLRGQALTTGAIDWTYGDIELKISYDIPAGNIRTLRTGNDGYGGSTSKFWTDIRWLYTKLSNFRILMNENTWLSIIDNSVNNISVQVNEGPNREITFFDGTKVQQRQDARDRVRITIYNKSGTVINAKTGALIPTPFLPDGKVIVVGENEPAGYELTLGSVPDPNNRLRLGYTHIAPTIEGNGRPGIWSRIYTPEGKPMQLLAETTVNMLPVILNPKRLVILRTDLP